MKLILVLFFVLASRALVADLPAALPIGQVLQQGDTAVVLLPQDALPAIPDYQLQQFGLMVTVMSALPTAATLQVKALIETEDGIRKWYRLEVPYQVPTSGSAWVPVFFNTGKRKVTAVYGLRVLVIDAGQEQTF